MKATAQMGGLTREEIEGMRPPPGYLWTRRQEMQNALCDLALRAIDRWVPVSERLPESTGFHNPNYVLAVDAKGRMSIGYIAYFYKSGEGPHWTFAKNIGAPTHWMPLPPPPERP